MKNKAVASEMVVDAEMDQKVDKKNGYKQLQLDFNGRLNRHSGNFAFILIQSKFCR